ncbi:MAG TPA: hypothetical protein VMM17_09800 [Gemmatimonadaceae bacterium]|nr:hypothetical protein [Gemmatimonadaceae bacterium]
MSETSRSTEMEGISPAARPAERPKRRRFARAMLVATGAGTVCAVAASAWLLRDPTPSMLERRSTLVHVAEGELMAADSHTVQVVRLQAASGLTVDLTVKRHIADSVGKYPLAVILGGHRTGKDAVRLLENTRGVVATAVSYPYTGDPRPYAAQLARDIPRIRRAFLDTPPALMLALDYLLSRDDVDVARTEGIGVSLGAPFIVIAGALDPRFSRIWVVHGSGGSFAPLQHNMREHISFAPLRYAAAGLTNLIISGPRLAPERWAAKVGNRSFVMINALDDERMPPGAVQSLFAAAAEPKEMIWMPGGHVRSVTEAVKPLVDTVMARIAGAEGKTAASR